MSTDNNTEGVEEVEDIDTLSDEIEPEEAVDPEDYKQRQRLKAVLEARETVKERRRIADEGLATGEITQAFSHYMIRRAVEDYIAETEWIIKSHDKSELYWNGGIREITQDEAGDSINELSTPSIDDDLTIKESEPGVHIGTLQHEPSGKMYRFYGIKSISDAPEEIPVTWVHTNSHPVRRSTQTQRTDKVQIPGRISWTCYRLINRFFSEERNLDIAFEAGKKDEELSPI